MDNGKIIDKLHRDDYNWNRKLSNLEEVLLKKKENKYIDASYQYEKEIEQAKINENEEKVEKKYELIEKELFYDYFYFYSIIYLDSKYKTLKDLLKWKDNLKKEEELETFFEDPIICRTSKIINLQQKINKIYTKCMRGKIELISIYKKAKIKRKIEKLSELFDKEIEQQKLNKKEENRIIEKYDKEMKKIQSSFFKDYAKIMQAEEKINPKIENRKKKLSKKIKKYNEKYEKKMKTKK